MNKNQQMGKSFPVHRLRNYGAGALAVLIISLGVAIVAYQLNMLPFSLLHLITWIFVPLGVFTCVFAVFAGRDFFYFFVYGFVMLLVGLMPVTFTFVAPMVLIGVLVIVLAVIGSIVYWRKK
jgi:hypothetical protein